MCAASQAAAPTKPAALLRIVWTQAKGVATEQSVRRSTKVLAPQPLLQATTKGALSVKLVRARRVAAGSAVKRVTPSTIAWATSMRSNGSLWSGGRVASATACAPVTASSANRLSCSCRRSEPTSNAKIGSCPRAVLIATSQRLMTLNVISLPASPIRARAVGGEPPAFGDGPEQDVGVEQEPHSSSP